MSDQRLIRLQAGSGLLFGTFLTLHLANTVAAGLGQGAYDAWMAALRPYYQFPLVELGAIGLAGTVHIAVGLTRLARRRKRNREQRAAGSDVPVAAGWLRLHRATGYFLLLVIIGHVAATRGPGLLVDMPADFAYLNFSLSTWPVMMFPYYFILFASGAFHLLHGGVVALNALGLRAGPPSRAWVRLATLAALVAGTLGILSMGGVFAEVDTARFDEFRAFYERYLPFMVTW